MYLDSINISGGVWLDVNITLTTGDCYIVW